MAPSQPPITVTVSHIEAVTPHIKRFTLTPTQGTSLPAFTGGSHVIVQMQHNGQHFNNAYSLMSSPSELHHYQIGVLREENSKGGSAFMHEQVQVGDHLTLTAPHNLFALANDAPEHVLIAGGIGITPFMSQLSELADKRASYQLHYAFRSPEHGAFQEELAASPHGPHCHFYADSTGKPLHIPSLIHRLSPQSHVYVCGPRSMIDAVVSACQARGFLEQHIHFEQFTALESKGGTFTVVLARSGRELRIEPGSSILKVIEKEKAAKVECLCREGVCGTCETRILEGEAEHLDQYLTAEEKAAQQTILICVSRARSERLVLDL